MINNCNGLRTTDHGLDQGLRTTDHGLDRPGVTLTEVLVAIFIMGVGLLSLLVLFPLGGMKMALAIKDERTGHCAGNAEAIAHLWKIPEDSNVFPNYTSPPGLAPITSGRSYPVYIDPLGRKLGSTKVGGSSGFARVAPGNPAIGIQMPNPDAFRRWFTLLDDLQFNEDGLPKVVGTELQRNKRYTWAYLCKQVKATVPQATTPYSAPDGIELTVVVYDRRPELTSPDTINLPNETVLAGTFSAGSTVVDVTHAAGNKPAVTRGTWILDATVTSPNINGYFYRVASVEEVSGTQLKLILTQPARANGTVCVIMENVAEVFEKGVRK